jgi:aminoglycoside 6'-N-acetyltransferase
MRLKGSRVTLRIPQASDAEALTRIVQEPSVARWWGVYDADRVVRELVVGDDDDVTLFLIEHEGSVAGFIQAWEESDPEFRHAGMDLFLTEGAQGQGLGPEAIRILAAYLIDVRGHHRITIDPAADNANAIRAYEKVGFRPVGRLRQYQRMPSGDWVDGLLMELLAADLVR